VSGVTYNRTASPKWAAWPTTASPHPS